MKKLTLLLIACLLVCLSSAQTRITTTCTSCNGRGYTAICSMCGGRGAMMTMFGPAPCVCFGAGKQICFSCEGRGVITMTQCDLCNGLGSCSCCHGSGFLTHKGENNQTVKTPCPVCKGNGKCDNCNGSGYLGR